MSADRPEDLDAITRQLGEYWAAWGRAMNEGMGRPAQGSSGFEAGGPWMAAIHQLARLALEQNLDSEGIATAWRRILRGNGLWPEWPQADNGSSAAFSALFSPWLDSPAFGPAREHLTRWQSLLRQQMDAVSEGAPLGQAIDAMMEAAIAGFEARLRQCEIDGKPLESARALFDLWIEAAEQAWESMASGEVFAQVSAQASQAQWQVQQTAQAELARFCHAVGLPTRAEVDQAHQRIVALERELDRLRAVMEGRSGAFDARAGAAKPPITPKTASRTDSKKAASPKNPATAAAKRTASKRSVTQKAGATKAKPVGKTVSSTTASTRPSGSKATKVTKTTPVQKAAAKRASGKAKA